MQSWVTSTRSPSCSTVQWRPAGGRRSCQRCQRLCLGASHVWVHPGAWGAHHRDLSHRWTVPYSRRSSADSVRPHPLTCTPPDHRPAESTQRSAPAGCAAATRVANAPLARSRRRAQEAVPWRLAGATTCCRAAIRFVCRRHWSEQPANVYQCLIRVLLIFIYRWVLFRRVRYKVRVSHSIPPPGGVNNCEPSIWSISLAIQLHCD